MTTTVDPYRLVVDPPEQFLAWAQAVRAEAASPTGQAVAAGWPTDPDERQAVARDSVGPYLIAWSQGELDAPGVADPDTREPWRWTPPEKRFLVMAWRLDTLAARLVDRDEYGRALPNITTREDHR